MINQRLISFSSAFKHIRTIREISFFLTTLLTPQEIIQIPKRLEILKMIAEGRGRRKIAEELEISTSTVSKMSNVFADLESENPLWWRNFKNRHGIFVKQNARRLKTIKSDQK